MHWDYSSSFPPLRGLESNRPALRDATPTNLALNGLDFLNYGLRLLARKPVLVVVLGLKVNETTTNAIGEMAPFRPILARGRDGDVDAVTLDLAFRLGVVDNLLDVLVHNNYSIPHPRLIVNAP